MADALDEIDALLRIRAPAPRNPVLDEIQDGIIKRGLLPPGALPPISGEGGAASWSLSPATAGASDVHFPTTTTPDLSTGTAAQINAEPDPDERWRNELYSSRGIPLPPKSFSTNVDFNKWAQKYQLDLDQDPVTSSLFKEIEADPAKFAAFTGPWKKANRLLYQIQKSPPAESEAQTAFRDAMQTWTSTPKVNAFGKATVPPAPLPPDFDYHRALDIFKRSANQRMGERNAFTWLSPEDKQFILSIGGENALAFWGAHKDYFTARHRLERLTGHPIDRDQQWQISENQIGEGLLRVANSFEGTPGADVKTTVPFEPNFHFSALAGTIPEIGTLTALLAQRQQEAGAQQNAQYASSDTSRQRTDYSQSLEDLRGTGLLERAMDPATAERRTTREAAYTQALQAGKTTQEADIAYQAPFSGPSSGLAGSLQRIRRAPGLLGRTAVANLEVARGFLEGTGAVFNAITFGVVPKFTETLREVGRGTALAVTGDARNYDTQIDAAPKRLFRAFARAFDPKSTDALAQYDQAMRDLFPTGDPVGTELSQVQRINSFQTTQIMLKRMGDGGLPLGLSGAARALGLTSPEVATSIGNLASMADDGTGLFVNAAGLFYGFAAARGRTPLKTLETPGNRFLKIDRAIAESGRFSPAATVARTPLVEHLERSLGKLSTVDDARGVIRRLESELATTRGPLNPPLTAAASLKIDEIRGLLNAQTGETLSPTARRALVDAAPALQEMGPMDALYVATGDRVRVGPNVSASESENLAVVARMIELDPKLPAPQTLQTIVNYKDNFAKAIDSLSRRADNLNRFTERSRIVTDLMDRLVPQLTQENFLYDTQSKALRQLRQATIQEHHADLLQTFEKFRKFELEGGERLRPNADLYKNTYRHLNEMVTQGLFSSSAKIAELLKKHGDYVRLVAGEETAELTKGLKSRDGIEKLTAQRRFSQLVTNWLEDHARPEIEIVPPNPNPRVKLLKSLNDTLFDARNPLATEAVRLSPDHLEALNSIQGIKFDPKALHQRLAAIEKDVNDVNRSIQDNAKQLQDVKNFSAYVKKLDPYNARDRSRLKISKPFRNWLESKLGSQEWLLRDDKHKVSLFSSAETLTPADLSSINAWHAVVDNLGEDARLLREGRIKAGALDLAITAMNSRPGEFHWLIQNEGTLGSHVQNELRYQALETMKLLGKDLTPADWQQLQIDLRNNNQANPLVPVVRQNAYMKWLTAAYKSGVIGPEQFQTFASNDHYYHGVFTREELAALPPIQNPSRYSNLRVSAHEFSFRIPEESWYAAWKDKKGVIQHYPHYGDPQVFDQAGIEAYVETHLPHADEVSVLPPWKFGEKEAAGLIVEAGTSTLDLGQRMGATIAQAHTNRIISQSHYALTPDQAIARFPSSFDPRQPDHFREPATAPGQGATWYYVSDPRARHLNGKFVHESVIQWQQYQGSFFGFWDSIAKAYQEAGAMGTWKKTISNPLLAHYSPSGALKLPGALAELIIGSPSKEPGAVTRFLRGAGNWLGISKVALSPDMPFTQLSTNLVWNLPQQGVYPWTPHGAYTVAKYFKEGSESWLKPGKDQYWEMLFSHDLIPISKSSFTAKQAAIFKEHWDSLAAYGPRIDRLKQTILAEPDPVKQLPLQRALLALENKLQLASRKAAVTGVTKLTQHWSDHWQDYAKFLGGTGPAVEGMFSWVNLADNLSKYTALRDMIEGRGMHPDDALAYVDAFSQNLHRAPEPIKQLSQYLGGSKFTTYPFDMARTLSNAFLHHPMKVVGHAAGLMAWNYAQLASQYRNPDEEMRAYAIANGHQQASWITDAQFLLGRIQLPFGGAVSLASFWNFLIPRSQPARELSSLLHETDLPDPMKLIGDALIGGASKFGAGSVALVNGLIPLVRGKDYRGNPLPHWQDQLKNLLASTAGPTWAPGGQLYEETKAYLTTPYVDVRSGEQKSYSDYLLKQFFGKIPANELDDHALLRAVMSAHQAANPNMAKMESRIPYEDVLKSLLFTGGAVRQDGTYDTTKADKIFQTWAQSEAGKRTTLLPAGKLLQLQYTADEKKAILERSRDPTEFSGFKNLTLRDQIPIFAKLNEIRPGSLSNEMKLALAQIIDRKAKNAHPELEGLRLNMLPSLEAWSNSETLPADVRQLMKHWYDRAKGNTIRSELNNLAPGALPRMPSIPGRR